MKNISPLPLWAIAFVSIIEIIVRGTLLGIAYITVRPLFKILGLKKQLMWIQRKIEGGYEGYTDEQYAQRDNAWVKQK